MSKPWLKSWTCSLDKRKVMSLPGDLFKVWQVLQWVAARYDEDGLLPSLDDCAFTMRKDEEWIAPFVAQLVERELLDVTPDGYRLHDWQDWQIRKPSDEPERVKERVTRHREAKKSDETPVTPRNALQNVTNNVTPGNARNAVKTREEEIRQEENRVEEGTRADAPATPTPPRQSNRKKPKVPIPDPFIVTEAMFSWADGQGFSDAFVRLSTEYFVNWAEAHDHRYVDWIAVWRNVLDSRAKEHGGKVVQLRRA